MIIQISPSPIPSGIPCRRDCTDWAPLIVFAALARKLGEDVVLVKNHTFGPMKDDNPLTSLAPNAKFAYILPTIVRRQYVWHRKLSATLSFQPEWHINDSFNIIGMYLHRPPDWQIATSHLLAC